MMKINHIFLAITLLVALPPCVTAQKMTINNHWELFMGDLTDPFDNSSEAEWEAVSLPHTWNSLDVTDETPGYYRGTGWYKKTVYLSNNNKEKQILLHFEGVNQVAQVYINGKTAGEHTGGYTAFTIDITPFLRFDSSEGRTPQEIMVRVDNAHNEDIPPLSADFTFYGGIYRDVSLMVFEDIHIFRENHGSDGVWISTPQVSAQSAEVVVRTAIKNPLPEKQKITVLTSIHDNRGDLVAESSASVRLAPGSVTDHQQKIIRVESPKLWSPENPTLYTVTTSILQPKSGKSLDSQVHPLGFRYFRFEADSGFYLNGEPLKLVGVNRHQDFQGYGNAIPDDINLQDVRMMKEMGANFLRIAHYPQDRQILELCDRLGILTSVEIPIVNRITESEAFRQNCLTMQTEMIRQNFNHPSVIIWAYMNEVLLRPKFQPETTRYQEYVGNITSLAEELEALTRREDPGRYTMIPNHGAMSRYVDSRLTEIPMLVGWNLYQGWYDKNIEGFASFLDRHRAELPHKPLLVTEYGGGADPRIRSFSPERFDFSVEYNNYLHRVYMKKMLERPFVAAAMVWNFADFNSEGRGDAVPHMNNKGITEWNRKPKDTYYLYQALLKKEPFIAIASRNWTLRAGIAEPGSPNKSFQPVEVYSNMEEVSLIHNGMPVNKISQDGAVSIFLVGFTQGRNTLTTTAVSGDETVSDQVDLDFILQPDLFGENAPDWNMISISNGDKRHFVQQENGVVWLPDRPYKKGGWGSIGGEPYTMSHSSRQSYGTDREITGTELDPIFQTQVTGIREYRFDAGPGSYELYLHFAELEAGSEGEPLPYNLDSQMHQVSEGYREFSVYVNGLLLLDGINNREELLPGKSYSVKSKIIVKEDEGISILFRPQEGPTILNAIELRKIL